MVSAATQALGTEPIGRLLLRYSMPAIVSMVVFSLYNVIDSIFIGHGVGALGISGLAVTFPIMNLSIACSMLIGVGGASVSSILLGQGDEEGAQRILGTVLVLALAIAVLFSASMLFFLEPLLICFGASADTLHYAKDFMQIILLGLPVSYTFFGLNHVMRATGYPMKALVSALCTVGVNIILAPIFIFSFDWGMRGAAFATVLAQVVGMLWVLHHFRSKKSAVHFKAGIYTIRLAVVRSIFAIGMSPFMLNVLASAVVAVINTSLMQYGGDLAIGAYGIINRVLFIFIMVVTGLTQGMQPIIGYNYGAKKIARVKQTLKYGLLLGGGITSLGMLASIVFPENIARLFTGDAQLIGLSTTGMTIMTVAFPIVGIQIVISNFFQSMGMARLSIVLTATRQLLFLIPCLVALPHFFGLNGIWYSFPIADTLAFIATVFVMIHFLRDLKKYSSID